MDVEKMMDYAEKYKAAQTPLVDLLRRVHPDATAEITEPNGWSYHTVGLGKTMHEAAGVIEKLQAELQQPANTVEVKAGQVLSRDECEAIWRAIAYLHVLEAGADARNEQLLVHYVQQAIAGLVRLIRPGNSD